MRESLRIRAVGLDSLDPIDDRIELCGGLCFGSVCNDRNDCGSRRRQKFHVL
jgi:hypothetical protein